MRTPNCECVICGKQLYRRPSELKTVRHVACMEHRAEAQRRDGQTEAQQLALSLGRKRGTNHLEGMPKSAESKRRRSEAMRKWAKENPAKLKARGSKIGGENHYKWNGGISSVNQAIRCMTEQRKWMSSVKERDGACVKCGSTIDIESHHIKPMAELMRELNIRCTSDALAHADKIWDIGNGMVLCRRCHCEEHGQKYTPTGMGRRQR